VQEVHPYRRCSSLLLQLCTAMTQVLIQFLNVVLIFCLFVKSYMFLLFSLSLIPVGTYVVFNLAQSNILKSHLSFNKAHNFDGVKC
jgi:hypothetical protein